jgi:hypothetical protein
MKRTVIFALAIFALFWGTTATSSDNGQSRVYVRTNLVSDIAGVARFTCSASLNRDRATEMERRTMKTSF